MFKFAGHRKSWIAAPFVVAALLIATACSSEGCHEQTDVKVRCTFHTDASENALLINHLSVWGVGSDSLVYNDDTQSEIALELNPNASVTRYVVQVVSDEQTFTDTLTFLYTSSYWFASMDCDCMTFNTLDTCTITGGIFSSVSLLQRVVNNTETTHVVLNL